MIERLGDSQQTLLASSVPSRRLLSHGEARVRGVGRKLFEALFSQQPVAGVYRASCAVATEREDPLRMVLRLNDPEIAALPWECMFDEAVESYVCRREPLVRHVPVPSAPPPPPLTVRLPLRILALVASPRELGELDVVKEKEDLERALATLTTSGLVVLRWLEHTTWPDLQDALLSKSWHVVHFIGHGNFDVGREEGVLALESESGRVHRVSAESFVDLLRESQPMPRLVVLNACESSTSGSADMFSGTAASLIRGGVSSVTAMQFEISDVAAIAFCLGFYRAIARDRGVDEAVRSGRVAILGLGGDSLEWITPTLYLRGSHTQLFNLSRSHAPIASAEVRQDQREQALAASERGDVASTVPLSDNVLAENPDDAEIREARERALSKSALPNNAVPAGPEEARDIVSAERAVHQGRRRRPHQRHEQPREPAVGPAGPARPGRRPPLVHQGRRRRGYRRCEKPLDPLGEDSKHPVSGISTIARLPNPNVGSACSGSSKNLTQSTTGPSIAPCMHTAPGCRHVTERPHCRQ